MSAAAVLTITKDGEDVRSIPIDGEAVLGRSEGCVIRLDDRAVSRQHALFRPVAGGVQVEKKSDFAPFSVNGEECTSALLKEGDVISIGPYLVKVAMEKPASQARREKAEREALAKMPELAELTGAGAKVPEKPEAGTIEFVEHSGPIGEPAAVSTPLSGTPDPHSGSLPELPVPATPLEGPDLEVSASTVGETSSPSGVGEADFAQLGSLGAPDSSLPSPGVDGAPAGGAFADASPESSNPSLLEGSSSFSQDLSGKTLPVVNPEPSGALPPPLSMEGLENLAAASSTKLFEPASQDGVTKISEAASANIKLIFNPGDANVTEFEITKDEISIGRGANCDVVLTDKKVSRKHALVIRSGFRFTVKDLKSANGIYVNGLRVEEHDLESGDRIRIGNAEFDFVATSADYESRQKDFIPVSTLGESNTAEVRAAQGGMANLPNDLNAVLLPPPNQPSFGQPGQGMPGMSQPGVAGIAGINGASKPKSLMEKFRALPKRRQYVWIVIVIGLTYFLVFDDDNDKPVAPKKVTKAGQVQANPSGQPDVSFESLTPEQKKFVESQHSLAFDYYRNRDYDKALFEIEKIFTIIPNYKDSREIERYAREGKRTLEAIEEERRRKAEEAKLKGKIAQLVEETAALMEHKNYEQARELFSQILALDPDNKDVAQWRSTLEQYEERRRLEEQEKLVQKEINDRAWGIYNDALALKKDGKFREAIDVFGKVAEIGATDKSVNKKALAQIDECGAAIAALRDPVLAEAKDAETQGDLPKAFGLFKKATVIDPPHPDGYKGMERIRGVLHERAKVLYTEAVLAESYSDFETARSKYKAVLSTAPTDDIYHERAERKLSRYFAAKDTGSGDQPSP